jgi:hypothetical protein
LTCVVGPGAAQAVLLDCRAASSPMAAEVRVTAEVRSAGDSDVGDVTATTTWTSSMISPVTWTYPVLVVDDENAEVTGSAQPFCFACKAKGLVEETIEVVLCGLGPLTPGGETFKHQVCALSACVCDLLTRWFSLQ